MLAKVGRRDYSSSRPSRIYARSQFLDDEIPDVLVALGRVVGVLDVADHPGLSGESLEAERPGWRVDLVVRFADVFRPRQAPVILEVDRRGPLVEEGVGRPRSDDREELLAPGE
jgi:hypothetical protein